MRGLEISAAPERQPGEGRGPGPGEVVVVGRAVDRQLGVPEGGGCVTSDQRQRSPVHLDRPGQAGELRLVDDDHSRRTRLRPLAVVGGRLQPPLRIPQTFLDSLELVAGHQRPDEANREHRPHPNDLVGDDVEPATDGGLLPVPLQRRDGQLDQVRCPLDVAGGQRVADRR